MHVLVWCQCFIVNMCTLDCTTVHLYNCISSITFLVNLRCMQHRSTLGHRHNTERAQHMSHILHMSHIICVITYSACNSFRPWLHLFYELEVHEPQVNAGTLHQAATKHCLHALSVARGHLGLHVARPNAHLQGLAGIVKGLGG
jgi:hypothetical protein